MTKLDIKTIITRYLRDEATTEEVNILYEWVKKKNNQDVFKKLVQADYLIRYQNKSWDSEEAFQEFLERIKEKENVKVVPFYSRKLYYKYAAAILLLVASTSYFVLNYNSKDVLKPNYNNNDITLELPSGKIISIDQNKDTVLNIGNGKSNIYLQNGVLHQNGVVHEDFSKSYNTLKVPYGKTLSVTLEDGSVVKLNAGSELSYPSSFANMNTRRVVLKGEAFFEIAKNPVKPFVVETYEIYTQVYGTVFNISSYEEDDNVEVVLVEGSVGVGDEHSYKEENLTMLKPSQKITNSRILKNSSLIEDVDVAPYISWVEGGLTFENEKMPKIIKKLERRFNVQIINENEKLSKRQFTGVFDTENIESILKTIQIHTDFKYVRQGKIITIKKQDSL